MSGVSSTEITTNRWSCRKVTSLEDWCWQNVFFCEPRSWNTVDTCFFRDMNLLNSLYTYYQYIFEVSVYQSMVNLWYTVIHSYSYIFPSYNFLTSVKSRFEPSPIQSQAIPRIYSGESGGPWGVLTWGRLLGDVESSCGLGWWDFLFCWKVSLSFKLSEDYVYRISNYNDWMFLLYRKCFTLPYISCTCLHMLYLHIR